MFPRGDNQDGGGCFLGEITKMVEVVSSGDNQDGGGCFLGEITKMVEDIHTARLLVTVFRFYPVVSIVRALCIHQENNSDVPEDYVEASTNQR